MVNTVNTVVLKG